MVARHTRRRVSAAAKRPPGPSRDSARPPVQSDPDPGAPRPDPFPDRLIAFLRARQTRKPSAHTMKRAALGAERHCA